MMFKKKTKKNAEREYLNYVAACVTEAMLSGSRTTCVSAVDEEETWLSKWAESTGHNVEPDYKINGKIFYKVSW